MSPSLGDIQPVSYGGHVPQEPGEWKLDKTISFDLPVLEMKVNSERLEK
jgi:hypothetical protein